MVIPHHFVKLFLYLEREISFLEEAPIYLKYIFLRHFWLKNISFTLNFHWKITNLFTLVYILYIKPKYFG